MKFRELAKGSVFSLMPDDGKQYIKIDSGLCNAKTRDGSLYNFSPSQPVEILNNFKREEDI